MNKYTCIKCNKKFNRKANYLRHLNRKFSCSNDDNFGIKISKNIHSKNRENSFEKKNEFTQKISKIHFFR